MLEKFYKIFEVYKVYQAFVQISYFLLPESINALFPS